MDRARLLYSPALRYFAAVAEFGAIRAASRELNIASSAINRQILWLEEALEIKLFDRIGRRLQLSAAGKILLKHVRHVLREFEETAAELDALRGLKRGMVRIATVESIAQTVLPELCTSFGKQYPGIQLQITVTDADQVASMILATDVDVGLTFDPPRHDNLAICLSRNLAIGAIVPAGHPLANLSKVSLEQCSEYSLILPTRGTAIRKEFDKLVAKQEKPPIIFAETNTLYMMRALVEAGNGIGFQTIIGLDE
ncbi:MAG: LysR family transcriptional regulator, partial [Cohaesibacteraceae bacterium]|nr:LysR family transcriptional regulator [Cohaesibacteraceae bacterium]